MANFAWPLPTNHAYMEGEGGGEKKKKKEGIYICMTCRMQMHFSASTIRAVLHSLHMVRERYGILIWSPQRCGVHSAQLEPPGQSLHVCRRS